MTFAASDPRAGLDASGRATRADGPAADPGFHSFTRSTVTRRSAAGSPSWLVRAQNVVLEYTVLGAGDRLQSQAEPEECVVLTPLDDADIEVRRPGQGERLQERGLVAVPPGDHEVFATTTTHVVRLFTTTDAERAGRAMNAGDYVRPHPHVALLQAWPEPLGGEALRRYAVGDSTPDPSRFGNIYRTRAFMDNWLPLDSGPRDPEQLSPHSHEDFEQLSLTVEGEYVHHIRTPWTPRLSGWKPDVHQRLGAPSVAIIPPPAIHTSQSVADRRNALIDVFAGPRRDFSSRPGWVLNAADYPMPSR